jgi:anti-sigma B factor antagonist
MQPRICTQRLDESLWVVELEGEHDLSTVPELEPTLEEIFATGTTIILDLSTATFIDSSVLGQILCANQRANADPHGAFVVVSPPGSASARLFDLTTAEGQLSIYPSRETALAALADRATPSAMQAQAPQALASLDGLTRNENSDGAPHPGGVEPQPAS